MLLAISLRLFVRAGEEWGGAGTLAVALWIRQQYPEESNAASEDVSLPEKLANASYTNMLCHTPTLTSVGLQEARKTVVAALSS